MTDIGIIQDHFTAVKNLLARQQLVENLVHRQKMPRHDLVESLVHKQHLVELGRLLEKLASPVIACVLKSLSNEERKTIRQLASDVRKEQILPG